MSQWTARYSPEQKEKIWRLRRVDALPWKQVIAKCGEGDDELPGFGLPMNSARHIVERLDQERLGRPQRLGDLEPQEALRSVYQRVLGVVDREMCAIERRRVGTRDVERIQKLVKLVREVRPLADTLQPPPRSPDARPIGRPDVWSELLREQEEGSNGGQEPSGAEGEGVLSVAPQDA
jgi:hypothetical protein